MQADPNPVKGHVVVAVNFDEDTEALKKTALSLAMQFATSIRFVHVIEPSVDYAIDIYGFEGYPVPIAEVETRAELIKGATSKMNELTAKMKLSVPVDGKILEGSVAEAVIAEAVASHANLIVCSARPKEYKYLPRGFSTALTLMHDAPVAVLVIGRNPFDATQDRMRILVADDLNESSKNAVAKAYEFASYCNDSRVRHVHVHGDFREKFSGRWQELKEKVAFLNTEAQTLDEAVKTDHDARAKAMRSRGGLSLFAAENVGVVSEMDIRTGDVDEQIHQCAEGFLPSLVVFGRHRFWRSRPFLIGRVPIKTMLAGFAAVLVIPPTTEQMTWSGFLR